MEYLTAEEKARLKHENAVLQAEIEADKRRLQQMREGIAELKEAMDPNPVKLAGKALERITGRRPVDFIVRDGLLPARKRYLQRRSMKKAIHRLFGVK